MRQSVWERFAHLSRFELGLNVLCRTIFVTFFNSAASMKPFPSLKYENNSALLSTCQEPTCQIFWRLLSTLQSCPGVLPGDRCSRCAICKMFTCFLIISMNSSKSSFPFPLTSYSMTRLSTCRLIWDKLEAKTLIGFRLQLWAITILHQSHHHLPISRQNVEGFRQRNPPHPRSGFAPSTSWLAAALSLILSHFDPSNNCEGQIIAKERFFG